jgi:hypothetical protein
VRERLRDATGTAIDLNGQLEEIIAVPVSVVRSNGKRGRIDHSQPPWNAQVAHLVMEMHALSRFLEDGLRIHLNMSWQPRGGDDANTRFALLAIVNLGEASEDSYVFEAMREIEHWNSRALVALGKRDLPQRLPRNVGESEPRCPYCGYGTLRFWSSRAEVRCINPECRDETNRRPVARMEYSIIARDWVLAWGDGSVGVPVADTIDQRIA